MAEDTIAPYDSRVDTLLHVEEVRARLLVVALELLVRGHLHDKSKLEDPEKEVFDRMTPRLASLEYGSPEYKQCLEEMGPALQHHYQENSHHPEHYTEGIRGMDLLDLLEMLCDWDAATLRHEGSTIEDSVEKNQARFGFSDELKLIFLNTLEILRG